MTNAEKAGLTISKPETPFEEMLNAIGDSLSDIASSDDEEDGEDKDNDGDDPAGGKLSDDDEPGWGMGTISNTVQYRMERFRQMQMKLVEVMQPGWGDAADCFHETDKKYGTTKLKVLVVVQPQTVADAASSVPMTSCVPMENLDRVPRKFQMLQVTSEPGSSHMRLGLWKLQPHIRIPSLPPAPMTNWSPMQQSKHDESVSFNRCILRPKLISIYKLDSHEDIVTAPASPEQWIGKLAFVTMY